MSIEIEKPPAQKTIVLIEQRNQGKVMYKPVLINDNGPDKIGEFLKAEKEKIEERLIQLKTIRPRGHSKSRSSREIRDIRKSRQETMSREQLETKLSILSGQRFVPVRLIPGKGGYKECLTTEYSDEQQQSFWEFMKQNNQVERMAEIAKEYENGIDILFRLYSAQYKFKYASMQEVDDAKKELEKIREEAGAIPIEYDHLFVPVFKLISSKLKY